LTDETPIFKQQYRLSQSEKEILQEQMEERKAVGFSELLLLIGLLQ
jgi:hypothetical protein